ncbi:MAG: tRNA-dihydrouridine synthase family protein [Synergistaceae bacterium]|jgi:tRNA-dihydrouridine synthase|nr:tRNA-dihydrouridine synthase family protein [Synergistaceae bacterium]
MSATAIQVGGLKLDNGLWLAPLAGVTLPPLREFFTLLGAGLTHTEMVSCMGLIRDNRKTEGMLRLLPGEGPVILQLFAGDADTLTQGAQVALAMNARLNKLNELNARFAALGINMACPMPKVTKRGAGVALMGTKTASVMVRGLKPLGLPVWVKTRKMPDDSETLEFLEELLEAGADNICIHGRTAAQRYEGRADRSIVASAAARFPGKISASGDVYGVADVEEYLSMGCVGVMLARGALANPCLFPLALRALGCRVSEDLTNPTLEQRIQRLRDFGVRAEEVCGPRTALVLLKRLTSGMFKGVSGVSELRRRIGPASSLEEFFETLREEEARMPGKIMENSP